MLTIIRRRRRCIQDFGGNMSSAGVSQPFFFASAVECRRKFACHSFARLFHRPFVDKQLTHFAFTQDARCFGKSEEGDELFLQSSFLLIRAFDVLPPVLVLIKRQPQNHRAMPIEPYPDLPWEDRNLPTESRPAAGVR